MLSAEDIVGVYAIIPTPAREGAEHRSATGTVDLEESARLVDQLIRDGVHGLIALGTTGECATLTEDEYREFTDAVLAAVAGRVPTFVGTTTTLGTHQTVSRLGFAVDQGATGTLLGLPMWQPCTEEMAVRFSASIAEAFPDLAVMVYMNVSAFRFDFPVSFWERIVREAPTVTSAKYTRAASYRDLVEAAKGQVNFLPMDMTIFPCVEEAPERDRLLDDGRLDGTASEHGAHGGSGGTRPGRGEGNWRRHHVGDRDLPAA